MKVAIHRATKQELTNKTKNTMKVIYVAGKYRDASEWAITENIRKAEALAQQVWQNGMVAICPHKNTEYWGGLIPDKVFLAGDFEIIKRCDALLVVDNWFDSKGARSEADLALEYGIPVFETLARLIEWDKLT